MTKLSFAILLLICVLSACSTPSPQETSVSSTTATAIADDCTIDLLARENRRYEWNGKIWTIEDLQLHLKELNKNTKIKIIRLRIGAIDMSPEQLVDIFQIANAVGADALYERDDGFKTIKWGK